MNRIFVILILMGALVLPALAQRVSELPETNYVSDVDNLYWLSKTGTTFSSRRMPWGTIRSNVNTGLNLTNIACTVEGRDAQILRFYNGERLTILSLDQGDDSGTGIWFSDDGAPYWQLRAETDSLPLDFLNVNSNAVFGITQSSNVIVYAGSLGIGTNDPQSKLHVADLTANSTPGIRLNNDVQAWTMKVNGAGSDEWQLYDVTANKTPFKVIPNSATDTLIISNGCVGIGKATPIVALDVSGAVMTTQGAYAPDNFGFNNSSSGNNAFFKVNSAGPMISRNIADGNPALIVNLVHSSATGAIAKFQYANATKLQVNNDGSIRMSVPTNGVAPPTEVLQPIGLFGSLMMVTTNNTYGPQDSFVTLTNFATIRTNGFLANGPAGFLTNTVAGFYRISGVVTALPAATNMLELAIFVNETAKEEISSFGAYDDPARVRTLPLTGGILYLAANSGISMRLNNRSATNTAAIWRASLTVGSP